MALGNSTKLLESGFNPSDISAIVAVSFAGDNAYPTGGTASFTTYLRTQLDRGVTPVFVQGFGDGGGAAYLLEYDVANDKLKVRLATTGLEVSNATDLSGVTFKGFVAVK